MLYWSREDFGIRPIVRISHQVIYSQPRPATPVTFIAINQVYADHYLDAALTVTLALEPFGEPADAGRRLLHDFHQPRPDPLPQRFSAAFCALGRPGTQP